MSLLLATLEAMAVGAWVAACCTTIWMLAGNPPTWGAFWRGSVLAGLGVMLLAEMVALA